jgi:hypothetical protein
MGLILIVLFLAAALLTQHFTGNNAYNFTTTSITVNPGSFSYYLLKFSNASQPIVVLQISPSANVYLFNSAAFHAWSNHSGKVGINGIQYAQSLNGTILAFKNVSTISIPVIANLSQAPVYSNNLNNLAYGNYYIVIDNTNNSISRGSAVNVQITEGNLNPATSKLIGPVHIISGLIIIFLLVGAIISIVYGIFSKGKPTNPETSAKQLKAGISKEEIDKLYAGVSKNTRTKTSGKRQPQSRKKKNPKQ